MDMKAIWLCEIPENIEKVYGAENRQAIRRMAMMEEAVYTKEDVLRNRESFERVEVIFSTWGMPSFSEEEIRSIFPQLKAVFYAAGSVQGFARPFLHCHIKVFSAWAANGVPVAEYTTAQIVLANKGFFAAGRWMSNGLVEQARAVFSHYPGNYGEKVGIIGAGMIGKLVIGMLKQYQLQVKVFDPFLPEEAAITLGVEKCSLEEIFAECLVVSNHLANNQQTTGMLTGQHFASMRPYATFLNTGRGAQVVEAELAAVLRERPDLTAILDVTEPEPPEAGHAFYELPNCILTPHIAGSSGSEVHRMAEYMKQEYERFVRNVQCRYEVTLQMLDTMA